MDDSKFFSILQTLKPEDRIKFNTLPYHYSPLLTNLELIELHKKLENDPIKYHFEYYEFVCGLFNKPRGELSNTKDFKDIIFPPPALIFDDANLLTTDEQISEESHGKLACELFKYLWLNQIYSDITLSLAQITSLMINNGKKISASMEKVQEIRDNYEKDLDEILKFCSENIRYYGTYTLLEPIPNPQAKEDASHLVMPIFYELIKKLGKLLTTKQTFDKFENNYGIAIRNIDDYISPFLNSVNLDGLSTTFILYVDAITTVTPKFKQYLDEITSTRRTITMQQINSNKKLITEFLEQCGDIREFSLTQGEIDSFESLKQDPLFCLKALNTGIHKILQDKVENIKEIIPNFDKELERIKASQVPITTSQTKVSTKKKSKKSEPESDRKLTPDEMAEEKRKKEEAERQAEQSTKELLEMIDAEQPSQPKQTKSEKKQTQSKGKKKGGNKITKKRRNRKITK
jgi:hypothetical protein